MLVGRKLVFEFVALAHELAEETVYGFSLFGKEVLDENFIPSVRLVGICYSIVDQIRSRLFPWLGFDRGKGIVETLDLSLNLLMTRILLALLRIELIAVEFEHGLVVRLFTHRQVCSKFRLFIRTVFKLGSRLNCKLRNFTPCLQVKILRHLLGTLANEVLSEVQMRVETEPCLEDFTTLLAHPLVGILLLLQLLLNTRLIVGYPV